MADMRCCMKCMQPINSSKCRHCGYEQGSQIDRNYCLPEKTLLNDRYLIGCLLGSGGFGNTYIAYDNLFDMKVAIKEYLPSEIVSRTESNPALQVKGSDFLRTFEDGRRKFLKEARILSSFKNEKGIVNVIDYFRANNTAYLVMEYLEGISLANYIETRPKGRLSEHDALEKLLPVFDVMESVHRKGLLHRDISPENIILSSDGVKLIDFGASRQFSDKAVTKTIIVKHGYAPPEQYSRSGNQGTWSDVYALAATLYKSLTGITPPDPFSRMQGEDVKTFKECGIFSPNEQTIMKALSLNIADRFASIGEFRDSLVLAAGEIPLKKGKRWVIPLITAATLVVISAGLIAGKAFDNLKALDTNESVEPSPGITEASPSPTPSAEPTEEPTELRSLYTPQLFNDPGQIPDIDKMDAELSNQMNYEISVPMNNEVSEKEFLFSQLPVELRFINHRRINDEENYSVTLIVEYPSGTVEAQYMPSGGQWTGYTGPLILKEDTYISTRASDAGGAIITGGVQITVPVKPDASIQEGPIAISGLIANTGLTGEYQVLIRTLDQNRNALNQTGHNNLDLQPGTTSYSFIADMDIPKNTAYSFLIYVDLNLNYTYDIGEPYARADDFYFSEGTALNFDFTQWNDTDMESGSSTIIFDHIFDVESGKVFMTIIYPSGTTDWQYRIDNGFWTSYSGGQLSFSSSNVIYARATHPSGNEITDSIEITVPWAPVENIENSLVPDPYLNDFIRKKIGKTEGDITKADLAEISFLDIRGAYVRTLEGVQYCTNLTGINMAYNPISDLNPLKNLTKMTSFIANGCLIEDVSPLSGSILMEHLALSGNPVRDINPLASMTKVNYLELTETDIEDISALSGMTSLERLYLWQSNVVDISPLVNCVMLKELYLSETNVTDFSALAVITTLVEFEATGAFDGLDFDLVQMPLNVGETFTGKINIEVVLRRLDLVGNYRLVLEIINDRTMESTKVRSDITNIRGYKEQSNAFIESDFDMVVGDRYSYKLFVDMDNDFMQDTGEPFAEIERIMFRNDIDKRLYFYDWTTSY